VSQGEQQTKLGAIGVLTACVGVLMEPRDTDARLTTLRPNPSRGRRYGRLRAGGSRAASARNRVGSLELVPGCQGVAACSRSPVGCSRSHLEASRDSGYAGASARESLRRQEPIAAGRANMCPVRPSLSRGRAGNIADPGPSGTGKEDPLNPVRPSPARPDEGQPRTTLVTVPSREGPDSQAGVLMVREPPSSQQGTNGL
jgi:hypothetical protein